MHLVYECPESFSNVHRKFEIALAVPEIIAIGGLVGVVKHNLGEEEVIAGRGWYHSKERW